MISGTWDIVGKQSGLFEKIVKIVKTINCPDDVYYYNGGTYKTLKNIYKSLL